MTRAPTITYVTDPDLAPDEQRRVLFDFVRCGDDQRLRVSIRLPDADDAEVIALLDWYLELVHQLGLADSMLPPLIHNRAHISGHYPEARTWLPAGFLDQGHSANTFSVHSLGEAQRAIAGGAGEVIFGHVFETESHPGEPGRGLESIRQIAPIPDVVVTAIGGIDERSIAGIATAGIDSVACIRAISRSADIADTIETMSENWRKKLR